MSVSFPHLVVALYVAASGVLLLYAANAYYLIWACLSVRRRLLERNVQDYHRGLDALRKAKSWPLVTTQVPLFNEIAVAERVINAAAGMDYQPGRHEIQILDDSTDETRALVDTLVNSLRSQGINIEIIRRQNRVGYKAGALAEGMERCQGELIAIFDADFVPPPDFLRRIVPHLVARPDAGWVQARWGHTNEDRSCLTQAQGMGIDGHFAIDQIARCGTPGLFMNFNGTAGVWRKTAIADAGGWTADTLTEDLDLSYRAQLRGWKGIYLPDLVVPGELPADANAFKSQQFRWAKGSVQTAVKLVPALFRSDIPLVVKIQGWFHLTHYAIHPFILMFAVLSLPLVLLLPSGWEGWGWANVLIVGLSLAPSVFYATGQYLFHERWLVRLLRLPLLILAGIGLALSNSLAVYEAVTGKKSPFLRTPKQGQSIALLYRAEVSAPLFGELVAGIVSLTAFLFALALGRGLEAQFLLLTGTSFLSFVGYSAVARLRSRKSTLEFPEKKQAGINRRSRLISMKTNNPSEIPSEKSPESDCACSKGLCPGVLLFAYSAVALFNWIKTIGEMTDLNTLEHKVLRVDYAEPRIHFALVCAAKGCPPLREAFVGTRLEEQLVDQAKQFLSESTKNRVDAANRTVYLSPIFKWYGGDFEKKSGSVLAALKPYWPEEEARIDTDGFQISYTDYDWSLNEPAK